MKIRIGFVSNSSSSSFLMVGAEVSNKEYDRLIAKKKGIDLVEVQDDKGTLIVGKCLTHWDEEGGSESFPIDKIVNEYEKLKKALPELANKIQLYCGTRYS